MMRRVPRGDVELAVHTGGDPDQPTVLLVHGYPDSAAVWAEVAGRLAPRWHVVRPDVRGHGASTAPANRAGYRLRELAADLLAVADAVSPDRPVHLVGHDWGSIQAWEALWTAPSRFASFTSISGPSLDHIGQWFRSGPRGAVLRQAVRSWYVGAFRLPVLPELLWRTVLARRWPHRTSATLRSDAVRGLELYRANIAERTGAPRQRPITTPVQLVVPLRDRYVSPAMADAALPWLAAPPQRAEVDAGHWVPLSHPGTITALVDRFARSQQDSVTR